MGKQNYQEVFDSICDEFLKKHHFLPKQREIILEKYKNINQKYIDIKLEKEKIKIISFHDISYPSLLREIANPPYILYLKGEIPKKPAFAVIGSRKISSYGKKCIQNLVPDLTAHMTIVSGGAYGCDSEAHEVVLASGGSTLVIIGTGIDKIYPASNTQLYRKVIEGGSGIVSIFPLGEPGNSYNFPQRNEIISGISLGTLVIEAGEKSGTLITAGLCLDQGRDLFAIPGDIQSISSMGCNMLLKKGEAKLVTSAQDILEEYHLSSLKKSNSSPDLNLDMEEKNIYELLKIHSYNIDELGEKLVKDTRELTVKISMLELKKVIRKNIFGKYEIF